MKQIPFYDIGDRVAIRTAVPFQNAQGDLFDPDTVSFEVRPPNAATTAYVFGEDDNVTRQSTGSYECVIDVNVAGLWRYRIAGRDEDENRGADQGTFRVTPKMT